MGERSGGGGWLWVLVAKLFSYGFIFTLLDKSYKLNPFKLGVVLNMAEENRESAKINPQLNVQPLESANIKIGEY